MTGALQSIKISDHSILNFQGKMLAWYDRNRRIIPWRAAKGEIPDPYHVWLSEIMCQQTTVPAVVPYFLKFIKLWPSVHDLAKADKDDIMREWAGLGYYARARNLHKCAQVIAFERGGVFPRSKAELLTLPGIGDYTAAAIMAIAFSQPETVVDGNIERIMARVYAIQDPLPQSKPRLKSAAATFFTPDLERPGDFAQSLMDLGSGVCTPKSPKCMLCPVNEHCEAYALGIAEQLPARSAKPEKPQKFGYVYWALNEAGEVLCHKRPDSEMLGGMIGLPTSAWIEKTEGAQPEHIDFIGSDSLSVSGDLVKHSFTHFDLTLNIVQVNGLTAPAPLDFFWVRRSDINPAHYPTLFKKVVSLCLKR
ncbi:MAG: A/G-specific adenine glycosylase [Alphaproteobacteria bacterium]